MTHPLDLYTPQVLSRLPPPGPFKGWLTGVGSRETPEWAVRAMSILAAVTYSQGYLWRSGGAIGSDQAIEDGVLNHPHYRPGQSLNDLSLAVYLPWNGFEPIKGGPKKKEDYAKGYINAQTLPTYPQAQAMAMRIHPMRERLKEKPGYLALHARNMFQPLGHDLKTPSKRLYCWAKPQGESVEGGTRSAVEAAREHRIPIINLANEYSQSQVLAFLARYAERLV
jgi:hypothetical protein